MEIIMYTLLSVLLLVGLLMFLAGFIGYVGTDNLNDTDPAVASAIGFLAVYVIVVVSKGSFAELAETISNLCGGIPYLNDIADYGSLKNFYSQEPLQAAITFMDTVVINALIEVILLLPLGQLKAKGFTAFLRNAFVGLVAAIIALCIFNYGIKSLPAYQGIVGALGAIISLITIGSIPVVIKSLITPGFTGKAMLITVWVTFSRCKAAAKLRGCFFKSLVLVFGIWLLERYHSNIANGLSNLSTLLIALGPSIIAVAGIVIILKSVFKSK